ncbi:uncharacterized protein CTHT_0016230 [Thermochaetoides thermophila DSM 1495]|uniref:UDENN FLCN/SMCR8-type domain-containing protein n=1 Tax=Chaetomium thermophilum (strain DSM 1495 / CBS 144.50 / IMI 039719) TaxID=759272 RepID=G0S274_CHATD|nr:hypothetical protein CTHT_0016230 [Thermochaetoides thermophila DSM 1495]EGS22107.1 hypothetical protein CTHT_0016230 [Thermochaetoides thermophila DSM 1495]
MTSILCLAHYCELHGPTPLMVTEGLPVPCSICNDEGFLGTSPTADSDRPRSSSPSRHHADSTNLPNITEALRRMSFAGQQRSSSTPVSDQEARARRASIRQAAPAAASTSSSAIETPPQSSPPNSQQQQDSRQESGFRKTYDEYVTRRAGPCEGCALTLPKQQEAGKDVGAVVRPDRGPTLRTRAPCARVFTAVGTTSTSSPSTSQSSSSVPSEDESTSQPPRESPRRHGTTSSVASRSSTSSTSTNVHTHYIDYTSTHEPITPSSFSMVRASCLRTLSLETLPRAPATVTPSAGPAMPTPGGSPNNSAYVTTHSIGAAASGGSIFFGDQRTGYTTAYIFRVPDVHARGHKRVYAFMALSTHPEPLAVKTFPFLSAAFRDMAAWIQELAEAEAERAAAAASGDSSTASGSTASSPIMPGPGYGSFTSEPAPLPNPPPVAPAGVTGSSSFLLASGGGLSRRMGGGFGGAGGIALKQRGLAELVGLPDFFFKLHVEFVRLLLEIGVMVGS